MGHPHADRRVVAALAIASTLAVLLAIGLAACHAALETPPRAGCVPTRLPARLRLTRHASAERRIEASGAERRRAPPLARS